MHSQGKSLSGSGFGFRARSRKVMLMPGKKRKEPVATAVTAKTSDVESVDAIIKGLYEVISFRKGKSRTGTASAGCSTRAGG